MIGLVLHSHIFFILASLVLSRVIAFNDMNFSISKFVSETWLILFD